MLPRVLKRQSGIFCWGVLIGLVLAGMTGSAYAKKRERVLESSRVLGRGGTFVGAPASDESIRLNPATISETKIDFQLRYYQLDLFFGQNSFDTISDLLESQDSTLSGDQTAIVLLKKFSKSFGKRVYGRLQLSPFAMRTGNFEIAPFLATSNFIDLHTPTVPEVQFESDTYYGAAVGYSHMISKTLHVALNIRPFRRSLFASNLGFSDVMGFLDSSDLELDDLVAQREGSYVAVDSSLIWQPGKWRYGLMLENIGYAAPTDGEAGNPSPAIPQVLSLGVYRQYQLGGWTWDLAFDFQDVINPKQYDYMRLLHFGTEFGRKWYSYDNDVGVVMGVNEGYLTGGAFLDLWLVRIDVTNYTVELGEYPGQRGDRRWAVSARTVSSF